MLVLVVSDFHLAKGRFLANGQINIFEDFFEDDRFQEFVEYYSTGKFYWHDVHLVLNGDIFNLLQVPINGIFNHLMDEEWVIEALKVIHKGHRSFFESLKKFLSTPNKKMSFIVGNHDNGMAFEGAQNLMKNWVGDKLEFAFNININGVYIEHGHRFEVINTVPENEYFVEGPNGKKILNLPWGSLFCISVLPTLKKERPFIDKIRPLSMYFRWSFFNDLPYFLKTAIMLLEYFIKTNFTPYVKLNRNFKTTLKLLKQITIYPRYIRMARTIMKEHPDVHTVVMGHTHLCEWGRFPLGKMYFNTGTWNSIPSLDAAMHESITKLTYVFIDLDQKNNTVRDASLNVWMGKWRPYREEYSVNT